VSYLTLAWFFVAAIAAHNAEEAIWLPGWSRTAGKWHHAVGSSELRFALAVLTALAAVAAVLANLQGKQSLGAYLLCGYALAMLLNVAVPHVLATMVMRRYAPGTATAVLINLPVTATLLRTALAEGYIDSGTFVWAGPLVVITLVALIPFLFKLGLAMNRSR
jgi:hypothetical protein